VTVVIELLDLFRQMIGQQGEDGFLAAVLQCLLIIPAFILQHVHRLIQLREFLFQRGFPVREKPEAFFVGRRTFAAPLHELLDLTDLKALGFQAFDDALRVDFLFRELTDPGLSFHIREKTFLVIIAER